MLTKKYFILQRKEYSPVLSISTTDIKAIVRFFKSPLIFTLRYTPSIITTANFNGNMNCVISIVSRVLSLLISYFINFTYLHYCIQCKEKKNWNKLENIVWCETQCADRSDALLSSVCGVTWMWSSQFQHLFTWFYGQLLQNCYLLPGKENELS